MALVMCFQRQVVPPGLRGHHAQQVVGIGVSRIDLQHLPIDLLCLRQPSRQLVLDRQLNRFWNGRGHKHATAR